MYVNVRSWKRSIMDLIRPELSELFPLEFATIYMSIRSQMSLIVEQMEPEHPELFVLEFAKIAESDFVYTIASTNADKLVPNMVSVYMTMKSLMSLIVGQIRQ